MGVILLLSGLFGVLIGLAIAVSSIAVFTVLRTRRQRGNPLTFLALGLLGFAVAFAVAAIAGGPLFSQASEGEPNTTAWIVAAFGLGLSPAGVSLGLLALRGTGLRPPAIAPSSDPPGQCRPSAPPRARRWGWSR